MGLPLCDGTPSTPCAGLSMTRVGEPDAGNLHVRFDEGERLIVAPYSTATPWPVFAERFDKVVLMARIS
jgi:hypothetical protein